MSKFSFDSSRDRGDKKTQHVKLLFSALASKTDDVHQALAIDTGAIIDYTAMIDPIHYRYPDTNIAWEGDSEDLIWLGRTNDPKRFKGNRR